MTIYIVQGFGGEWADKFETIEKAFHNKKDAEKYESDLTSKLKMSNSDIRGYFITETELV